MCWCVCVPNPVGSAYGIEYVWSHTRSFGAWSAKIFTDSDPFFSISIGLSLRSRSVTDSYRPCAGYRQATHLGRAGSRVAPGSLLTRSTTNSYESTPRGSEGFGSPATAGCKQGAARVTPQATSPRARRPGCRARTARRGGAARRATCPRRRRKTRSGCRRGAARAARGRGRGTSARERARAPG